MIELSHPSKQIPELICPHCHAKADRAIHAFGNPDSFTRPDILMFVVCLSCAYILVLEKDTLRRPTALEWDGVLTNPEIFRRLKELQHTVELFILDCDPNQRPN